MAVLNSIQRGSVTFSGTSTTININAVDLSKTILLGSYSIVNSNTPAKANVLWRMSGVNEISVSRITASANADEDITFNYEVIEFESGVRVQRGTVNDGQSSASFSSVDTSKSFILSSFQTPGSTYGFDDCIYVEFNNSSSLNTNINNNTTGSLLAYQVVEYEDCTVQSGVTSFSGNSTTQSITAVDLSKSILIYSHANNVNALLSNLALDGRFSAVDEIEFSREGTPGSTSSPRWFVVEFSDEMIVNSGTETFAASTGLTSGISVSGIAPADTAVLLNGLNRCSGKTSYESDDRVSITLFRADITADTLTLTREDATEASTITWFTLTFAGNDLLTGSSAGAASATAALSVLATLAGSSAGVAGDAAILLSESELPAQEILEEVTTPYPELPSIEDEWYGFDFLGTPGDIEINLEHIDTCIKIILTTTQGSVPHHPDWFVGLNELVDRPVTVVRQRLIEGITRSLGIHEPRIDVLGVTIAPAGPTALETLVITVRWRVRDTAIESVTEITI